MIGSITISQSAISFNNKIQRNLLLSLKVVSAKKGGAAFVQKWIAWLESLYSAEDLRGAVQNFGAQM